MAMAETYQQAQQEDTRLLFTDQSGLTGETVNRFTHIQQGIEDLTKKILMLREMGRKTACCFQRCAGMDAINAVYAITLSAVYYVFRCLLGLDVPNNSGCLAPIELIAPEGTVTFFSGKIEMGQGVTTSLAQMAAEELGVGLETIEMVMGDTATCPWDAGTWGSLSTRAYGNYVRAAGSEITHNVARIGGIDIPKNAFRAGLDPFPGNEIPVLFRCFT